MNIIIKTNNPAPVPIPIVVTFDDELLLRLDPLG